MPALAQCAQSPGEDCGPAIGYRLCVVMDLTNAVLGGDFRVERPLAEGGMGGVYLAQQLSTGLPRALKVMHPTLVSDPAMRDRFAQEARIGGTVPSEHVVQVIAAGIDTNLGVPWLAMELLDGEDLAALSARRGALPLTEVVPIFRQLCHALGAAHSVGIVHRDVKPENVFLANVKSSSSTWQLKVLDFGIAKLAANAQSGTRGLGTPLWMAPEQTESQTPSPAADVWSLGLLAFYLLSGGKSYWRTADGPASGLSALMREILIDPLPPASVRAAELGVALPPGFDAWFSRTVVREPHQRYGDAHQAFSALEMLGQGTQPTVVNASSMPSHVSVSPVSGNTTGTTAPKKSKAPLFIALGLGVFALGSVALALGGFAFALQDEIGDLAGATSPTPTASSTASAQPAAASTGQDPPAETAPTTESDEPPENTEPSKTAKQAHKRPSESAATKPKKPELQPINRAAVQAKVDAAAASAATICASKKAPDASVETYSGSRGFRPDGTYTLSSRGVGGSKPCVTKIMRAVTVGKYKHDQEWHVEVFKWSVTVK